MTQCNASPYPDEDTSRASSLFSERLDDARLSARVTPGIESLRETLVMVGVPRC